MMNRIIQIVFASFLPLLLAGQPHLEHGGNSTARIVANGRPMLMIGSELGNSSASTPADVKRTFSHLHQMGLNTVLVPLSWELIEPQEGAFDMSSLDIILTEARRNVALNSRDRKPGQYPSGGPLAHLIDLWHCGAPSIDVLGVDIYDKGIKSSCPHTCRSIPATAFQII